MPHSQPPPHPGPTRELPERPFLAGLYHVVALGPDRVQIANAGRSVVLGTEGMSERLLACLAALDGTTALATLEGRFPGLATALVASLAGKGLVTAGDGSGAEGPWRQVATALELAPDDVATRLGRATVAVAGCGPVGGAVALQLAKAGVGRLVLSDSRPVSASEAAASPVLGRGDAGRPRSEMVAEACRQRSEGVVLAVASPIPAGEGQGADLAVVSLGYEPDERGWPDADACLAAGKAYLVHTQDALEALVGPLVPPGGQPCHRCVEARRRSHLDHPDEDMAYRRHRARADPEPDAFLAAQASVVAGLVATEALRGLLGAPSATTAGVLVVDLGGPSLQREAVLAVPGCQGCASAPSSAEQR